MAYKSKTQPLCRLCGKPIPKRTTRMWPRKPDSGHSVTRDNGEFWKEFVVEPDAWPTSRADCQRLTNMTVASVSYFANPDGGPRRVSCFTAWDGESYDSEFFCNGDHAKHFGYLAARSGMKTTTYEAALAAQPKEEA